MPFVKGQSGNPGGRRKKDPHAQEIARLHCKESFDVLLYWMRQREDGMSAVKAATTMLARGYGHPTQHIDGTIAHVFLDLLKLVGTQGGQLGESLVIEQARPAALRDGSPSSDPGGLAK